MGKSTAKPLPVKLKALTGIIAEAIEGASPEEVAEVAAGLDNLATSTYAEANRRQDEEFSEESRPLELSMIPRRRIREHRAAVSGLTQEGLAEAMARLGFEWKRLTVVDVESGKRSVNTAELVGLAGIFATPVVNLLLPVEGEWVAFPADFSVSNQGRSVVFGRNIDSATLREAFVGDGGAIGSGDFDWLAARRVVGVEGRSRDWRPGATESAADQ